MTTMLSVAQIFGSTLQRVRRQQGLTQKELGTMTKTSHTFIGEMERGMKAPNLNLVVTLAIKLRVSVEELVAGLTPARDEKIAVSPEEGRVT
jgi:transcriptional regulator with XRE-family HTH domain